MSELNLDTTKGAEERVRTAIRQAASSYERKATVTIGFRDMRHPAWINYAERGMGNPDGQDGARNFIVRAENFMAYLVRNYPHTTYDWIRLNTGWLRGSPAVESEPTPAELALIAQEDLSNGAP